MKNIFVLAAIATRRPNMRPMTKRDAIGFSAAIILALFGMGAIQRVIFTETFMPKSGAWCFESSDGYRQCGWPPYPNTTTPPPIFTPSATPTGPVEPSATKFPSRTPSATATAIVAPPSPTLTPFPPLLVNGGFEQANNAGWTVFHLWEHRPQVNDERGHPESRVEGAQSLRLFNEFRCWFSGVYQTVSVQQFKTYKASVWGRTWASQTSVFPSPSDLSVTDGVALGVDTSGGVDPRSTGIIWVEADNTEVWRKIELQFVAFSDRVTIFIRARLGAIPPSACQWSLPFMVGFVDDAGIEVVP